MLALAALVAVLAPATSPRPEAAKPARVQVVADEFSLTLSRRVIRSGPVIVELANFGEDPHDLRLHRLAPGAPTREISIVAPGEQESLRTTFKPGRVVLWCSLGDHRARGMEAILIVKARKTSTHR